MKPTSAIEEQALVLQAKAGSEKAQYLLYTKYVHAMYHTIIRMVGSREDAQDLTQEAFTKVFQQLHSFRGEASIGAWIKRICINTALNALRKKKKIFFEELDEKIKHPIQEEIDEQQWAMNIERIHEAVKHLPEGSRMVFNLYLLEGYKHAEVAATLGISESTSKTQYKRAKRLIKEYLSNT